MEGLSIGELGSHITGLWSRCPWLRRRLRVSAILFPTFTVGSLGRGQYWSSWRIALILVS